MPTRIDSNSTWKADLVRPYTNVLSRFMPREPQVSCCLPSTVIAFAFVGSIPTQLGKLTALIHLDVSWNKLRGERGVEVLRKICPADAWVRQDLRRSLVVHFSGGKPRRRNLPLCRLKIRHLLLRCLIRAHRGGAGAVEQASRASSLFESTHR